MLSVGDIDFLSACVLVGERPCPPNAQGKYYTHGGFINFHNGACLYAIKNCAATRKYLEARGYTHSQEVRAVSGYNLLVLNDILVKEGPASENYRKILSYITEPAISKIWGKLDQLEDVDQISKAFAWLRRNDIYLGTFKAGDFLRSAEGKYAILSYAKAHGIDCFDDVKQRMAQNGIRPGEFDPDTFASGLKVINYDYFDELLHSVENKKKGSPRR